MVTPTVVRNDKAAKTNVSVAQPTIVNSAASSNVANRAPGESIAGTSSATWQRPEQYGDPSEIPAFLRRRDENSGFVR